MPSDSRFFCRFVTKSDKTFPENTDLGAKNHKWAPGNGLAQRLSGKRYWNRRNIKTF